MKKKISFVLLFLSAFLIVTGCSFLDSNKEVEDEVTSNDLVVNEDGYTVTLTKDFKKGQVDGFDTFYQNEKIGFTSLKESFESLAVVNLTKDSTLEEYGEVIIKANNILNDFKESKDGSYMYTTYTKIVSIPFYYYTVIKKGNDGFWLFNFYCREEDKEVELPKIEKFAATLKIS